MSENQDLCGLFGKVPQQPDFVSHHLPRAFQDTWHAWLRSGIGVSQDHLQEDWQNVYLTSPVWRFALGPGVCGGAAVFGVLIPSIDEIGRCFPLAVAHAGDHAPWAAYLSDTAWFDAAEEVALAALSEHVRYSQLVERLEGLPLPDFEPLPAYRTAGNPDCVGRVVSLADGTEPRDAAMGLLDHAWGRLLGGYSLWWTSGSDYVEESFVITPGLPSAGQLTAFLDGEWRGRGWALARQGE